MAVHVVVLQHMEAGHPWYLRDLLAAAGATWSPLRPDRGDPLPPVEACDAVWVMGGAMQVWQEEEHPWLVAEKRFIRDAVEAGVPYLGVCLGHQLLADAFGGEVGHAEAAEVGLYSVAPTAAGQDSALLSRCGEGMRLQWHEAEVRRAPREAVVLASSKGCEVQAMAVGEHAYSLQYHVEADTPMLPAWCESESAREKLDALFGEEGLAHFQREALAELDGLQEHARTLLRNWFEIARRRRRA